VAQAQQAARHREGEQAVAVEQRALARGADVVADEEAHEREVGRVAARLGAPEVEVVLGAGRDDAEVEHLGRRAGVELLVEQGQEVVGGGHDADGEGVAQRDDAPGPGRALEHEVVVGQAERVERPAVQHGAGAAAPLRDALLRVGVGRREERRVAEARGRAQRELAGADDQHRAEGQQVGQVQRAPQPGAPGQPPGPHRERQQRGGDQRERGVAEERGRRVGLHDPDQDESKDERVEDDAQGQRPAAHGAASRSASCSRS
jgi:hypothetical protein